MNKLDGVVEVDETYFSGKIKATPIGDTTSYTLQNEISNNVKRGSVVCTGDHRGYMGLYGFNHRSVNHSAKEFVRGNTHTNDIESVWAL